MPHQTYSISEMNRATWGLIVAGFVVVFILGYTFGFFHHSPYSDHICRGGGLHTKNLQLGAIPLSEGVFDYWPDGL